MKDLKYLQLWDAYNPLLTEHQREICELYYLCDLSLTEIAEQAGISKQSVSDTLAKSRALLDEYESKLHCIENGRRAARERAAVRARLHGALEGLQARHPALREEVAPILALLDAEGDNL